MPLPCPGRYRIISHRFSCVMRLVLHAVRSLLFMLVNFWLCTLATGSDFSLNVFVCYCFGALLKDVVTWSKWIFFPFLGISFRCRWSRMQNSWVNRQCLITCRMLDEQLEKVTREASELRLQSAKLTSQVSSVHLLSSVFTVLTLAMMPKYGLLS